MNTLSSRIARVVGRSGLLTTMLVITLSACTSTPGESAAQSSPGEPEVGRLEGFPTVELTIDGELRRVALANSASLRRQGLRAVSDLGDLAGMWFTWGGEEVDSPFTMQDTLIPLDIAFFDSGGRVVDTFAMVPCDGSECPLYRASGRYVAALEVPADGPIRLDLDTVVTPVP